jgi:phosphoribosylglycinamide formyltransferase-1
VRAGVLASGAGTNLQALIDAPDVEVVCLASDRPDAGALARAEAAGIPRLVSADEEQVLAFLSRHRVGVVALAGYMRLVSRAFLARYPGRVLNVHPSLLPAFPGTHAIEEAIAYGVRVSGATVHIVDEGIDTGPIVLQEAVPVDYDDTPAALLERIHRVEHRLLPEAVRLVAAGRVEVHGRRVRLIEGVS